MLVLDHCITSCVLMLLVFILMYISYFTNVALPVGRNVEGASVTGSSFMTQFECLPIVPCMMAIEG